MLAIEFLQWPAFPQAHTAGDPAFVILTPGPRLGNQRLCGFLARGKAILIGVVPLWVKQHGGGEQLGARQRALAALNGELIGGEAPACIKRLAKDAWFVASEYRLEPHLGGHGVNPNRPLKQSPWADGLVVNFNLIAWLDLTKIPITQPLGCLWMGLDDDPRTWVLFLGDEQHFKETIAVRVTGRHGRIAKGLGNDQNIARFRAGNVSIYCAVFG